MADYKTIDEAIAADISNMTAVFTNQRYDSDGSTYTITNDINFYSNGVKVTKVTWNGDGLIHLKAGNSTCGQFYCNYTDGSVINGYIETGMIQKIKFFKITWDGTSYWNNTTSANYRYKYHLFLMDNGKMIIYCPKGPASNYTAQNYFHCGSNDYYYNQENLPNLEYKYFLYPSTSAGSSWTVRPNFPPELYIQYYGRINNRIAGHFDGNETLYWNYSTPGNTRVTVECYLIRSTGGGGTVARYKSPVINGQRLGLIKDDYQYLDYTVTLTATESDTESPKIWDLKLVDSNNLKTIYLNLQNAVTTPLTDPIDIQYTASTGVLGGLGGIVPDCTGQVPVE